MAVSDWNNLTAITREKVLPRIVDQIGEDCPLLDRLWKSSKQWNGGVTLDIPVKYRHNSQGGSYSGLDVLDTGQEKTRTRATFNVKQMYQPIVLSNIDLAKNKGEQVADLMESEMNEAKESLKDKFGTKLQLDGTGNSSKDFAGLTAAIDDSTNVDTYGGITRSSYTWFKSNYTANVGSIMLSDFATMYSNCKSGNESPSVIVTTESLWDAYEALLQPQVRLMQDQGGQFKGEGGMKALSFRGTPIIADEYVESGKIWFINEKHLNFYHMQHPKFPTDKKGFTVTPMREPTNQDGQVGYILWYGQLVNDEPRKSGVLVGATA